MAEKIKFSRSLYMLDAVQSAVDAYSQLASFSVDGQANEIVVEVENINPKFASVLLDSFCNHVLFETIVRHRKNNEVGEK